MLAMSSVSVYGVMLAGWASGSKYPLVGSVRASAQMVSYEAAVSLSIAAVVLVSIVSGTHYSTLSTNGIIVSQAASVFKWNIFRTGVVPFVIFMIAITAELNRPPFDLVEAEQELVGGFHTEYSSIRFALFFLAEFMNTITMSAVAVTLFLGGPDGPGFHFLPWLWPILWFSGKTLIFLFCYVWVRAALPRLRYDQLMDLGWKWLIPISLGWLLVLGALVATPSVKNAIIWSLAIVVGCGIVGLLLSRAFSVGKERARHVESLVEELVPPETGRLEVDSLDLAGGRIMELPGFSGGPFRRGKALGEEESSVLVKGPVGVGPLVGITASGVAASEIVEMREAENRSKKGGKKDEDKNGED